MKIIVMESGTYVSHYGPGSYGWDNQHKETREECSSPECAWPREGDLATGTCDGVKRTGEIVDLSRNTPVIVVEDGTEYPVTDLRKPVHGMYCAHGLQIMLEDRNAGTAERDTTHPMVPVNPWPCTEPGCTLTDIERAEAAEAEAYELERWDEYYRSQGI